MSIRKIHICCPHFDIICLQGGCLHCQDYPKRYKYQIKLNIIEASHNSDNSAIKIEEYLKALHERFR